METQTSAFLADILKNDLGVKKSYRHSPKWVTPGDPIETGGSILKRYALAPREEQVPEEIDRLARVYLAQHPLEARGLGFVILHRCGRDFYFLIVSTWRGNNEVWETVFYKDGAAMTDFALWPRNGMHKPTFCVWELALVWHEKEAWERFLKSARDETAAQVWLGDLCSGAA
ncbi:MAG: hypothetical protein M3Q46_03765 [Verrucomicrobiota bacterium]|nr:hypothetical protein [Verrucomicrobiota bacterium]